MAYKIDQIEGIGEVYAEKLIAAGIATTDDLLEKCHQPQAHPEVDQPR